MEATFRFAGINITVNTAGNLVFLDIEEPMKGVVCSPDHPAAPAIESRRVVFGLTKSAARSVASAMMGAASEL